MPSNCANGSSHGTNGSRQWPEDIGIVDLEFYFPREYVDQSELESHDGVGKGKYLIGLGQTRMGICAETEDINSLCLTVTRRLLEKSGLSTADVGFLMVGTETLIDKSKSIKSVLMQLFEESGNYDVQGIDTTNACFGGTASLHHAVDWIESSSWDGRYAIVVCGDIAVYAEGPARPTGGAGAIAMLIGPNAPLVLDRGVRTHYMRNTYDFYKPDLTSEYPVVDGKLSILCYMQAADSCYTNFRQKFSRSILSKEGGDINSINLDYFDGLIFHAPYCKLVQKTLARLAFNEFQNDPKPDYENKYKGLEIYRNKTLEETVYDKDFETAFLNVCRDLYEKKTKPNLLLATEVGNMYTASVYSCLVSYLMTNSLKDLAGKRILLFSYGSGLAASMFSIKISSSDANGSPLHKLYTGLRPCLSRLSERIKITPEEFSARLKIRETIHGKPSFFPEVGADELKILFPGTYYLVAIDDKHRRNYKRKPPAVEAALSKQKTAAASVINGIEVKTTINGSPIATV